MKFYVVWKGREPGIFTDWVSCKRQVDGFAGARYKSFATQAEAEAAFRNDSIAATRASTSIRKKSSGSSKVKSYTAKEVDALTADTKIFTDGGCDPNPGKAGSGIAVYRNDVISELWYGLYNPAGTNNTAELNALHQALIMAKSELSNSKTVAVFCDSQYAIQCITAWASGWKKKGWKKKTGEIKNLELIKKMYALYQLIADDVAIYHVNGHVGIEGNELADRMSMLAIGARDVSFRQYRKTLDVDTILAMSAG